MIVFRTRDPRHDVIIIMNLALELCARKICVVVECLKLDFSLLLETWLGRVRMTQDCCRWLSRRKSQKRKEKIVLEVWNVAGS
jgi:hypothetical protein